MPFTPRLFRFVLPQLLLCASALAVGPSRAVINRVAPQYPEIARRMHISGTVILQVSVTTEGKVASTKVESGHALLVPAAESAVRQWRFAPSSEPSESTINIDFSDSAH